MDRVSAFFRWLVGILEPLAEQLGGPGLTVVAFFDSSFLSLPEVSDALTVLLTARDPTFWWYYAAMTTLGSVCGCYALYALGRKGGEAFLRRRMRERHVEWGMALFKRHGMLAIIVPSLLPPPMPFKLFVLIAGIVDVKPLTFIGAVVIGRGFRYGVEAWLAYRYGAQAWTFIRENLPMVSIGVAGGLLVFGLLIMLWQRRTV
jgi:membrane protein YqaA with SNARE-associated domain